MPDAQDARPPISLEYADAQTADAAAARGLVYVLAAFGLSHLISIGWMYGDKWFGWTQAAYSFGPNSVGDVLEQVATAIYLPAGLLALGAASLGVAGRLRSRTLPLWSAGALVVAGVAYCVAPFIDAVLPPASSPAFVGSRLPWAVSSLCFNAIEILVPAVLLWLFTRRRIAAALAGGGGAVV